MYCFPDSKQLKLALIKCLFAKSFVFSLSLSQTVNERKQRDTKLPS